MIGVGVEKKKIVVQRKDQANEPKAATRGGSILDQSLREMRTQGVQQFLTEHKKKPIIPYFIHKTDRIYESKNSKVFLSEEDFIDNV